MTTDAAKASQNKNKHINFANMLLSEQIVLLLREGYTRAQIEAMASQLENLPENISDAELVKFAEDIQPALSNIIPE